MNLNKEHIANRFKELQNSICNALEQEDGVSKFISDKWEREEGGGGDTRVIQNGAVFEKGGVNFSAVWGAIPKMLIKELYLPENTTAQFFATGVSIVIHPQSPMVPIIHMNVRYFEIDEKIWWFGGGIDLTPIYVDKHEAKFFHTELKRVCDKHADNYYPEFKKWADDYFFIKHRNETRGIGGIFFDKLNTGKTKEEIFNFVIDVGELFTPTYCAIVNTKKALSYTNSNKEWQFIRRGRYAEFNLIYDRGTKFGLETNGRTESILMSLPPQASWKYNPTEKMQFAEKQTIEHLLKGIDWSTI